MERAACINHSARLTSESNSESLIFHIRKAKPGEVMKTMHTSGQRPEGLAPNIRRTTVGGHQHAIKS